jgi:C-terminal processing protease CtpA/Prc
VKLLPGNIGYLRLDGFMPADLGGRTAVAAMSFLSGADAIIFDLRNNGGGSPTMIQLLSSYLFSEPTHLNDLYYREGDRRNQFWTLPWVDGERRPDIPVYVLTSARTFSAAEEFTNNLKVLKRATIVGETPGAAPTPARPMTPACSARAASPPRTGPSPTSARAGPSCG